MKERIIYDNYDFYGGRTEEELKQEMKEYYEEYEDFNDETYENKKYDYLNRMAEWDWDDAQEEIKDIQNTINGKLYLMYGTFGGWRGRQKGAKVGNDLVEMMYSEGSNYYKIYINEDGELVNENTHHDGTNYYKYRVFNEKVLRTEGKRGIYVEDNDNYYGETFIEITEKNEEEILEKYTKKIGTEYYKELEKLKKGGK